jgi:nucleoside 2-deoxyribosyltransferase
MAFRSILAIVTTLIGAAFFHPQKAPAQSPPRIYLAGPLGFSEAGRDFKDHVLVRELTALGYRVIDPFALTDPAKIEEISRLPPKDRRNAWQKLDMEIAKTNRNAIDNCDAVLAILDGVDVDSGTAAEIGYAFAVHKPILGYRGDFRISSDNEGATVNLQVEYFIRASGGDIVLSQLKIAEGLSLILSAKR